MPNNLAFKALNSSFTIQLQMNSDWHIGSGAGRPGDVDRLVRRDENDLPFIPAKTLTGIWRDACERAALGLDDGTARETGWSAWIPFLFGDQPGQPEEEALRIPKDRLELPRPAAFSVRTARFPQSLRDAIKAQSAVKEAVTFVKPGIAIDPRSGRARNDFLRFEEMARGGATLTAECRINWDDYKWDDDNQKLAATALLLAGAKLVERIGAKRRRGAGQCKMIVLESDELNTCWNWIESLNGADPPPPPATKQSEEASPQTASEADGWACVDLLIESKAPVIVSEQAVGNLVKTLDYIPGAHLLPILRRQLKDKFDVNRAIFSGRLIVTNATVDVAGVAGRPTPFALFHEKVGGGLKLGRGVYNRLCEDAEGKPQLKGHRSGYIGASPIKDDELPAFKTVKLEVEPHNVVEDKFQRPTEDVGGVYSYQVIGKGATLRAQLRVRKSLLPKDDETWFARLNGDHTIGRSKKDDYGAVCLKASKADCEEAKHELKNELTVWLLSHLLLRDERLRPTASIHHLAKALGEKLGVEKLGVTLQPRDALAKKLMSAISRQHRTDSWHVGWGLPRPSLVGLAAGTCVVFKIEGTLDEVKRVAIEEKLREVEADGVGERRAEGYGRLCFNDPLLATPAKDRNRADDSRPPDPLTKKPVKKGDATFAYAHLIETEALRHEFQRAAIGKASTAQGRTEALGIKIEKKNGEKESRPPMSQLGGLRSAIGQLRSTDDVAKLTTEEENKKGWLDHLEKKEKDAPHPKWPPGSIGKIRALVKEPTKVWSLLGIKFDDFRLTETSEAELKNALWAETVRALVDACVRAQKRDTEPKPKGDKQNGATN